jgi:heptosyltransferase II
MIIAVAPGSVWKTKIYPKDYFIEIAETLVAEGKLVVLLGGQEDKVLCEEIKSKAVKNIHSVAGTLSIVESIELLKRCNALISNDSAPTHLGMIANIPVLTIYCSTIPEFGFYPYNSKSTYISLDGLKCKPCGIHGHNLCPIKTFECGYNLSPQKVLQKFSEIITA